MFGKRSYFIRVVCIFFILSSLVASSIVGNNIGWLSQNDAEAKEVYTALREALNAEKLPSIFVYNYYGSGTIRIHGKEVIVPRDIRIEHLLSVRLNKDVSVTTFYVKHQLGRLGYRFFSLNDRIIEQEHRS